MANIDTIEQQVQAEFEPKLADAKQKDNWELYTQLYFQMHAQFFASRQQADMQATDDDAERKRLRKITDMRVVSEFEQIAPTTEDKWLNYYAKQRLGDDVTGSRLSSILRVAHADFDSVSENTPTYALKTWQGLIDARTGQPLQTEQTINSRYFIPHYDPEATAPTFKRVLDDLNTDENPTLGEDLLKMYAYATFGGNHLKAMFILYGDGNDGKSLIQNAVKRALGNYVSIIDADRIQFRPRQQNDNKFMTWLTSGIGRKFYMVSEFPEKGMLNNAIVKLVHSGGGGTIDLEQKFANATVQVDLNSPIVMDTNFLPDVTHVEPALLRRLVVIKFHKQYLGDDIDYTLDAKLAKEQAGILNMLIDAYDPDWRIPDKYLDQVANAREEQLQEHTDTISTIIDDYIKLRPDETNTDRYVVKNVHNAVGLQQALKNNHLRKSDIREYFLSHGVREVKDGGTRVYIGLRPLTPEEKSQETSLKLLSNDEIKTKVDKEKALPF